MSEDNVVVLQTVTKLDLPVTRVLDAAAENLESGEFVAQTQLCQRP